MAGLERVYETGHVYRAEPHASSRHLTEYYSLDVEFGFIDGPEDVIQFERELLTDMFEKLNRNHGHVIREYRGDLLPSMLDVACWEFDACLEMLRAEFGRTDLTDDLDPEGERQLCETARAETGIPAVFVLGFPLAARPFYTAPGDRGAPPAASISYSRVSRSQPVDSDCIAGKTWRRLSGQGRLTPRASRAI